MRYGCHCTPIALECRDEFFVTVSICSVAGLKVSKAIDVIFLSESVCCFFRYDDVIAEAICISRCVTDTHMSVETSHDDSLYAEFFKKNVKVGLKETAVAAFWNDIVLV